MAKKTQSLGEAAAGLARLPVKSDERRGQQVTRRIYSPTNLPPAVDRSTDVELERALVSFRFADGGFLIRRELTDQERGSLERRSNELADCLRPVSDGEVDRVALALADMLSGFPSQERRSTADAAERIDAMLRVLASYPAWAIEIACSNIHRFGVVRKGTRDRQWPPSDAELIEEVEREVKQRKSMHAQAVAMLAASVDDTDLRRTRA